MKRMFAFALLCAAASLTGCFGSINMFNFGHKGPAPQASRSGLGQVTASVVEK